MESSNPPTPTDYTYIFELAGGLTRKVIQDEPLSENDAEALFVFFSKFDQPFKITIALNPRDAQG